ncbi:hypothetical protein D3C73_1024440 [compost metagenome]
MESTVDVVGKPGAAPAGTEAFFRHLAFVRQEVTEEIRVWPITLQRQFAATPERYQ